MQGSYRQLWMSLMVLLGLIRNAHAENSKPLNRPSSLMPIRVSEIQKAPSGPQRWLGRIQYFKSDEKTFQSTLSALKIPLNRRPEHDTQTILKTIQDLAQQTEDPPKAWAFHHEIHGLLNQGMNPSEDLYAGTFTLHNDTDQPQEIAIESNTAYLQALSFFELKDKTLLPEYLGRSGLIALDGPSVLTEKTPIFKTSLPPHSQFTYVFLYEGHVMQLELQFFTKDGLASYLRAEENFVHLAAGFLFCVLLYNSFLWIAFRDKLYLLYSGFVSMTLCFVLSISGVLPTLVRKLDPNVGDLGFLVMYPVFGMMLFGIAFGDCFNETLRYQPKLRYARWFISSLLWVNFPLYILAPRMAIQLQSFLTNAFIIYVFYGAIKGIKRGNFASRIFLLSWCSYLFSGIYNTLAYKGVLPPSFWTEWGTTLGVLFEGIGLSIAISFRLKKQEAELHEELANAMQAKVLLTNELVHRTTQPLRKAIRAVDSIKQDLKSIDDATMNRWTSLKGEHILQAQQDDKRFKHIQHHIQEIESGILHTEHTIEDIYALSSLDQNAIQGSTLKDCWKQLILRLSDSSMRADLDRLKVTEEDLPKFEIRNNPVILNLALEMIFKLWLATGQGNLFLNFNSTQSSSGDELIIRAVQPFSPISKDLLEELLKHINYILYPYGMQMEISPSGWELKVCFYLSENQRWRHLRSA